MATLLIVALRAGARCVITRNRPRSGRKGRSSLLPHHPNGSFTKCYLCSRFIMLPMFPVAPPGALLERPSREAPAGDGTSVDPV